MIFEHGRLYMRSEIDEHLNLPSRLDLMDGRTGDLAAIEAQRKRDLMRAAGIEKLKHDLLVNKQMLLVSVGQGNYRICYPHEQTQVAVHNRIKKVAGQLKRLGSELANVDHSQLTANQRAENALAQVKLDGIRRLANKRTFRDDWKG
jgi:hypothetical protein